MSDGALVHILCQYNPPWIRCWFSSPPPFWTTPSTVALEKVTVGKLSFYRDTILRITLWKRKEPAKAIRKKFYWNILDLHGVSNHRWSQKQLASQRSKQVNLWSTGSLTTGILELLFETKDKKNDKAFREQNGRSSIHLPFPIRVHDRHQYVRLLPFVIWSIKSHLNYGLSSGLSSGIGKCYEPNELAIKLSVSNRTGQHGHEYTFPAVLAWLFAKGITMRKTFF